MPFSLKQLARVTAFAVGVISAQLTQAQAGSPFQFSMQLPSYNYGTYEPVVEWPYRRLFLQPSHYP